MAVGEAFLSAILQVLFDRLASQKVIDFFMGRKLNSQLLKLKTTMASVKKLLGDAEEKQIINRGVREWLDNLKDAFYDADDLLDEIAYAALGSEMEAGPQTGTGRVWNFLSSQLPLVKIESKLVEINEKLQPLLDQKNALGLKEGIGEKPPSQRLPTTSLMDESVVYGREEDKEIIVQLLLSDDANCNKLGLIPIVGMGGVGKTTLAQSVYNDSKVKEQFGFKAWIYVSEEFDVLKVTRSILNGVSSTTHDFDTLDLFQVALKDKLTDKKFLLVLDDVWNDCYDHWDLLLKPLKAGAKGSKIIVTTRLQSVASVIGVNHTHHLNGISEEECWALFSKHAFEGMNSSAYPKLEEIGREIVKKCNGLPLAAKSLGSLLRSKRKPEEWDRVLKNDIWNLPKDNILPALRLSYHFLSSPLKQCFAYCAIFSKGYWFKKEELVLLWMGEGFLGETGFSMEREVTGEEYFDDLVSRSFFNPDPYDEDGFIMHDLINDLARSVAGEFCARLDDDEESCKVTPKTRHLYYVQRKSLPSIKSEAIATAPLLRTFSLAHYGDEVIYDTHALMKFERLRVLDLSFNELKLDDSIGNLKHLRYLDLSHTSIEILPESLCCLYNLEILLLVKCDKLVELPLNLGNLANLCVLDNEGTRLQKMPPHMGKLSKLQKLSYFVIGKESGTSIQELGNLRQLRGCLVIRNLQNVMDVGEALRANIKGKIHLEELKLVWKGDVDDSMHARRLLEQLEPHKNVETLTIKGYGGTRFPYWIDGGSHLLRVVTLQLHGCRHFCQLPPLGQLQHMKKLSITDFPGIVSIGPEFYGTCTSMKKPFQHLEVLRFENMAQWQEWVMCRNEEEVFHLLQELSLINCPAFKQSLPQHLPSLITLEITGSERLVASLPTVPRILDMHLDDLSLRYGFVLSVFRIQSPLIERIEQLGCCGLLNALASVEIGWCDILKCFPLESFSNLKHLKIVDCPNFEMINGNSISLLSLEIKKCPEFRLLPKEGLLSSLTSLSVWDLQNLESVPEEGLPFTITFLSICNFADLESLNSKGLQSLTSLAKLVIGNCPKLQSLPEEGLPLSLSCLYIYGCSLLKERCEREKGEDWPKISHIPEIYI